MGMNSQSQDTYFRHHFKGAPDSNIVQLHTVHRYLGDWGLLGAWTDIFACSEILASISFFFSAISFS